MLRRTSTVRCSYGEARSSRDNLWFSGQYPLTSYSVLYYFVAGWIGNVPLAFAAIVLSAVLFSALLRREWGAAARWPAWIFALTAAGQLFTGSYDYAVGFAALLSSLFFFQRRRPAFGVVLAGLTLALSPLAFIFLGVVLVAAWLPAHRVGRVQILVAGALAALACAELMVIAGFPVRGLYYPYGLWRLLVGMGVGGLGIALGWNARRRGSGMTIASLFLVWLILEHRGVSRPITGRSQRDPPRRDRSAADASCGGAVASRCAG